MAGRKRSRDEASTNLDSDVVTPVVLPEPVKEDEDEWIYGEGMVLIKKSTGYVADASSQSGTWVEERAEQEARAAQAAAEALAKQLENQRPLLRSHKSQRLHSTSHASASQDFLLSSASGSASDLTCSPQLTASASDSQPPVVDDFTLHLGIGWSRISDDANIQAAARGWARFIENRYPLTGVHIRLESRGLQSYLVEADQGYFLFAEDLRQGRLVSTDPVRALDNLRSSPPIFDGEETLSAVETPRPVVDLSTTSSLNLAATAPTFDTDMDMN